jgi:hypothetical protein
MATQGTATLDFGAFPGSSDTSLFVSSPSILAGSLVEAWIFPAATTDHSADEHLIESVMVMAGNVVASSGFTIYMSNTSQITEPVQQNISGRSGGATGQAFGRGVQDKAMPSDMNGGIGTRIYGKWSIGWVWN